MNYDVNQGRQSIKIMNLAENVVSSIAINISVWLETLTASEAIHVSTRRLREISVSPTVF